jgi:hypothetical protein
MIYVVDGRCDAWVFDWQAEVTVGGKRDMRGFVSDKRIYQRQTLVKVRRILELWHCRMLLNRRAKMRWLFKVTVDHG